MFAMVFKCFSGVFASVSDACLSVLFIFFLCCNFCITGALLVRSLMSPLLLRSLACLTVVGARSLWQRPDARQIIRE